MQELHEDLRDAADEEHGALANQPAMNDNGSDQNQDRQSFLRKLLGTRLIDIAANDQWMICYCLILTLLEWQIIPFLKDNLFGGIFPRPSDNLPSIFGGIYFFVVGLSVGLGGVAFGIFSSLLLVLSLLRCIALYAGKTVFDWYPNQQQNAHEQQNIQPASTRILRFLGLLPFQIGVILVSRKMDGFLWEMIREFTKPEFFQELLGKLGVYFAVMVLAPIAIVWGIVTLRHVAQRHPAFQRWIRARLPIV